MSLVSPTRNEARGGDPAGRDRPTSLEPLFARVFRRLGLERPAPNFEVQYRPFTGIRSTVVFRQNTVQVRISDLLGEAPPLVLEALAEILLARLFRRQPSREARACYLAYVLAPAMRRRTDEARRRRGRKRLLPARGRSYDLEKIFARLNRRFFRGELLRPRLGWSLNRSRTLLGHYDSAHGAIIISRWLDSPSVPRYLVDYLVFHEMLHMQYPVERRDHRRVVHSVEFRAAEKQFPNFEKARGKLKLIGASGRLV